MRYALGFVMLLLLGCATGRPVDRATVDAVLDDWHRAASKADEAQYFLHFAPDAVFLGTDATERWTTESFRIWAHPHFARGKAWTFTSGRRNVTIARGGTVAWFDEELESSSYGQCRGSGVLQKYGSEWRIEQYNLTIPIPNDLAEEFVTRIRSRGKPQR